MTCRITLFEMLIAAVLTWSANLATYGESPDVSHSAQAKNGVAADLSKGFTDPPLSARPGAYWAWLNGNVSIPQLTRELEEMKGKGLSGPQIFDVGARDPDGVVPAGPAFMSPKSLKAIGHAVREAGRLGLEVGFITSSSWNAGGSWVTPEHASKGLFHSRVDVDGPERFSQVLPFPKVPEKAPKRPDGSPVFFKNIAVLAVPRPEKPGDYEFVFEVGPPGVPVVEHVVLYNAASGDEERYGKRHLFAKDFRVYVSATTPDETAWKEVVRGLLRPTVEAQRFDFDPVPARYVKLAIQSGHNPDYDTVQLGEFEVYSTDGRNVVLAYDPKRPQWQARLLRYTSALGGDRERNWSARNIHDGDRSGPRGTWCSAGRPLGRIKDAASIINLTDRIHRDGRLTWDVPPGKWTLLRFVCTNTGQGLHLPSPNSHGLAIDHFSSEATQMHFRYLIDKLQKELGPLDQTALAYLYLCSYELRGQIWTPDLLEQFQKRRGYDMTLYLPVLLGATVEDRNMTDRFRYDFDTTLGELLVDGFYAQARAMSNRSGVALCAEAGGPGPPLHNVPVDALKALGQIDRPRGEFWNQFDIWVVKETACASHTYGKRIVDMEAFTSWRHWQDGPFELKPVADRALCEGTNHFTFHTWPHQPPEAGRPGWAYHAGTHMGPNRVWWPMARPFIDYLARCSYLLQQGLFVGDVCYYYGDGGYKFVPPKHVDPSLGFGYDYDVTNSEVLLERMQVRDGRIVLPDGLSYELLVLPDQDAISLEVLRKLEQLVAAGATVVGPKPTRAHGLADYPRRDQHVRQLADKLWGLCDGKAVREHAYGKGKIVWGRRLRDVLQATGIGPDFRFISRREDTDLDFIHRRTDTADIYFVRNKNLHWEEVECIFRVTRRAPELWIPDSGEIRRQPVYEPVDGGTKVPLRLAPAGSVFVVFRRKADADPIIALRRDGQRVVLGGPGVPEEVASAEILSADAEQVRLLVRKSGTYVFETASGRRKTIAVDAVPTARTVPGPWQVQFSDGLAVPAPAVFDKLISWTEHPDPGVKYFSGVATYSSEFDLPPDLLGPDRQLRLDLGQVRFVAEVKLNGTLIGTLWKPPFQVDVTGAVRPGSNHLVVRVANVWANRLIGDAQLPPEERVCRTNMTRGLVRHASWKETSLRKSGLLGPVRLVPCMIIRGDL